MFADRAVPVRHSVMNMGMLRSFAVGVAGVLGLSGAGCRWAPESPESPESPVEDVCSNADEALGNAGFVFVVSPRSGERVSPGFQVQGCSRTFESTVVWRLTGANGAVLASGHTTGGGVDGPGPFSFPVAYSSGVRQIGHLEVYEEDASDGEGHPPGRSVIPLVLNP